MLHADWVTPRYLNPVAHAEAGDVRMARRQAASNEYLAMPSARWTCEVKPLTDWNHEQLAAEWTELETRSQSSFFQSWHWTEAWLSALPAGFDPFCWCFKIDDQVIAMAILVSSSATRHGLLRSHRLFVGETGDSSVDAVTVEFGGPLVDRQVDQAGYTGILASLASAHDPYWNELYLPGLDEQVAENWTAAATLQGFMVRIKDEKPGFEVNLESFSDFDGYLALLSSNTRSQVRRAIRGYESIGDITIDDVSADAANAQYFHRMKQLHQDYWEAKGFPGGFGSRFQNNFHEALWQTAGNSGVLQLLRVRAADSVIGYLYNFLWQGTVYCYQSGFNYPTDNPKLKPGLVCHALAIKFNKHLGASSYNFLAGDSRYKRSLSTGSYTLSWPVLQRPMLRFSIERKLAEFKNRNQAKASR